MLTLAARTSGAIKDETDDNDCVGQSALGAAHERSVVRINKQSA